MTLIAAVAKNKGIGYKNNLLFRIPEDMRFFRETTLGKVIVMGHSTLKSFKGAKPLDGRTNIIMSRDKDLKIEGATVCGGVEGLFETLKKYDDKDVYVIGGQSVYGLLADYCDTALVTEIDAESPADAFFDMIYKKAWQKVSESEKKEYDGVSYRFCEYKNNNKRTV
ncbi:MAG: dihydrofolate reductase [Clostridiales bacterium]|jgi:dihydrofolate reductase|nr:dihydrofolate reductase [Clostridiales bacterium]